MSVQMYLRISKVTFWQIYDFQEIQDGICSTGEGISNIPHVCYRVTRKEFAIFYPNYRSTIMQYMSYIISF
jgi:hypothetical protein